MQTNPEAASSRSPLLGYDPSRHAALLADYCLSAREGERLLVAGGTAALPLVREVTRALLTRGARPVVRLDYPGQDDDFAQLASEAVLDTVHPADLADVEALDGSLRILTPEPGTDGDTARRARLTAARASIAAARARKKWSLTLFPTPHAAAQAGMTEAEFGAFVMRAMFLDRPDPAAAWGEVRAMQARLIERLSRADTVRIEAPGTDLTLRVGGRTWANSDGKRNMPSGEVFTGPHEDNAEGVVTFTIPASYGGQMVRGARLVFRAGEVVEASAEEGGDVLRAALATDPGARRLGELGIGTNFGIQTPTGNILFDEKIGGTVHLALGRSYPETGGVNGSAIHWDLITDLRQGGRLSLDGEVVQEGGRFVG
ncbi:peptidase M29, aminopeptidase II [Deinococcus phoenicis]|uniref:Peptidase M29, aminopeptidase II n=1 Tax=Deinococcus phoenicis TaxID=1476583 RepID=A0A016QKW7_9DEIO|nr:aminopeptidase [Deinococcus phoenicis]EYB66611.1 peptidase M29, aminopeptidase II [Deinococcus phoenicis]